MSTTTKAIGILIKRFLGEVKFFIQLIAMLIVFVAILTITASVWCWGVGAIVCGLFPNYLIINNPIFIGSDCNEKLGVFGFAITGLCAFLWAMIMVLKQEIPKIYRDIKLGWQNAVKEAQNISN